MRTPTFGSHLDRCDVERRRTEVAWLSMEGFQISANGHRFGDARPVVEFEHGQGTHRVFLAKLWRPIVLVQIHRDDFDLQGFFGDEYPNTPGLGALLDASE